MSSESATTSRNIESLKTIGLIGGIASGKSTVASIMEKLGCISLNADRIVHELFAESFVQAELKKLFGSSVVSNGLVDRAKLSQLVFGSSENHQTNRRNLEDLLHPLVRSRILKAIENISQQQTARCVVVDAPLLLEAGFDQFCDEIWFIDTPKPLRRTLAAKRGWADGELEKREQNQLPVEEKKARADVIISNSSDLETLERTVQYHLQS